MRAFPLACLLLTLATPAMAEDRYGPQRNTGVGTAAPALGPRLSWPGKVDPAVMEAAAAAAAKKANTTPQQLPDGVLRRTSAYGAPAPAAPAPAVVAAAAPPPENAPWKRLTGISTPRPTATPATMEEAAPPAQPTTPVAAPGPLPAAQAYPASTTEHASAATGEQAKYYSLHRDYGETPDAIPVPEKSQVFLAGGPLASGVGEGDEDIDKAEGDGTGKTAAAVKARLAADWRSSSSQ